MVQDRFREVLFLLIALSLVAVAAAPRSHRFRPLSSSDEWRDSTFVCREDRSDDCYDEHADGTVANFIPYLEQVLANEWDPRADTEALKAGIIAIRTFADRNPGCGALLWDTWEPGPGMEKLARWNKSQAYWLGSSPNWHKNTITDAHEDARDDTDGVQLLQLDLDDDDWEPACAKYNRDCGDPTKAFEEGSDADKATLQSVPDPVARDFSARIGSGMAQNGTVAWERGSAPWNYRQMLTHYYSEVRLDDTTDYYRWTWLNSGNDKVFLDYYGPTNPTPDVIYLENPVGVGVEINVQNTSRETWHDNDVKLSYRWYTTSGSYINSGPTYATRPHETFDPSETEEVDAWFWPPDGASAGSCYLLKWDLKRGSSWFGDHNWPTLKSTVCVENDTYPPDNPPSGSVSSSSGHVRDGWVTSTQIALDWWGAGDPETGVDGYSILWNQDSGATPDTSKDTTESSATSGSLGHGNWYLHVRTVDNAGNWTSGATHYGPYGIDAIAPTSQVTGSVRTIPGKSWFYVDVSGSDEGSGVASYEVQYKIDDGDWKEFGSASGPGPHTLLFCHGRDNPGHTFHFRSQATDVLGLTESWGEATWSIYIPPGADPTGLFDVPCQIIFKNYAAP